MQFYLMAIYSQTIRGQWFFDFFRKGLTVFEIKLLAPDLLYSRVIVSLQHRAACYKAQWLTPVTKQPLFETKINPEATNLYGHLPKINYI